MRNRLQVARQVGVYDIGVTSDHVLMHVANGIDSTALGAAPYDVSSKSASKIGSITSWAAV